MIATPARPPLRARHIEADLVWMHTSPLDPDRVYLLKHTTRMVRAQVTCVSSRLDMDTLAPTPASTLVLNDIGHVRLACHSPILCDPYRENRATGAFILIDPVSDATVAAGMIRTADEDPPEVAADPAVGRTGGRGTLARGGGTLIVLQGASAPARAGMAEALARSVEARGLACTRLPAPSRPAPTHDALAYAAGACVDAGLITICSEPVASATLDPDATLYVCLDASDTRPATTRDVRPDTGPAWQVRVDPLRVPSAVAIILDELCHRDRLAPTDLA